MNVLISIVNYNSAALTIESVTSLDSERQSFSSFRVVIVDNCSPDNSYETLNREIASRRMNAWVSLIKAGSNAGFANGNNLAIRYARDNKIPFDIVVLLNPDTTCNAGSITKLCEFLSSRPEIGICGPRLQDVSGLPRSSAFRFPSVLGELEGSARFGLLTKILKNHVVAHQPSSFPHSCDWVAGACMAIKRQVLDSLSPMDEQYFLYFEETDYCLQAARRGWQTWYFPNSNVVHYEGQSTKLNRDNKHARIPAYWFDSRRRFFVKNFGMTYAICADLAWLLGHLFWYARSILLRRSTTRQAHLTRDFIKHTALVHSISELLIETNASKQTVTPLFEQIRRDLRNHDGDIFSLGFWAISVMRYGRWRYRCKWTLVRRFHSLVYKSLYKLVQIVTGIELPCEANIGKDLIIDHHGGIVISGYAVIGDNCRIRNGVTIGLKSIANPAAPRLGNNVDVGAGAKILGDVTIGNNVLIGANAVVLRDVPDDCIAVGVPAVIKAKPSSRTNLQSIDAASGE